MMEKKKTSQSGDEHKRTTISQEQENYVRMGLLLSGNASRAVRIVFNRSFDPTKLDATMKEEYNKLKDLLKKRIITKSQWILLDPCRGR